MDDVSDGGNATDEIFCGLQPHDFLAVKFFMISVVGTGSLHREGLRV